MRSVKGIIIGFLLILLGFAAAQYSLIAAGVLAAGGLAAVIVSALPKRAEAQPPQAAPAAPEPAPAELSAPELLPDILTDPPVQPEPPAPPEPEAEALYKTLADAYTRIDALACRGPAWMLERDIRLCRAFCARWADAKPDAQTAALLREKARFVECDGERLAEQISRMKEKESRSRVTSYEQELKAAAARVGELERLMQNLYEDKCTGTIPQTVFQTLMRKYETERAEKAAAIPELEQKVRAQLENRQDANRWMEVIRRYTEITALDESILFELVDRIEVGEARKVNGQRICDVKVVYRYVGSVDDALAQERQEAYEKAI